MHARAWAQARVQRSIPYRTPNPIPGLQCVAHVRPRPNGTPAIAGPQLYVSGPTKGRDPPAEARIPVVPWTGAHLAVCYARIGSVDRLQQLSATCCSYHLGPDPHALCPPGTPSPTLPVCGSGARVSPTGFSSTTCGWSRARSGCCFEPGGTQGRDTRPERELSLQLPLPRSHCVHRRPQASAASP